MAIGQEQDRMGEQDCRKPELRQPDLIEDRSEEDGGHEAWNHQRQQYDDWAIPFPGKSYRPNA